VNKKEFISYDEARDLAERFAESGLDIEKALWTLGLEFYDATCSLCNQAGFYKWHAFGRLFCPTTNQYWYITPGQYLIVCLKSIARGFAEGAGDAASDAKKKGEGALSQFFMGLFVGLFVAMFKGIFMLAGWVIQTISFIVWKLTAAKPSG
jgi:hypothetical protein